MPLEPDDYRRFLTHIAQFGLQTCPVCNTQNWITEDIVEAKEYSDVVDPFVRAQLASVPLLLVVCRRCFYVRHFAWLPIRGEDGAERG